MIEYKNNRKYRVRKFLQKKYKMSYDELNTYLIIKYHLDHYPTREEIINLEKLFFYKLYL